jgi:hypothetical protein
MLDYIKNILLRTRTRNLGGFFGGHARSRRLLEGPHFTVFLLRQEIYTIRTYIKTHII